MPYLLWATPQKLFAGVNECAVGTPVMVPALGGIKVDVQAQVVTAGNVHPPSLVDTFKGVTQPKQTPDTAI